MKQFRKYGVEMFKKVFAISIATISITTSAWEFDYGTVDKFNYAPDGKRITSVWAGKSYGGHTERWDMVKAEVKDGVWILDTRNCKNEKGEYIAPVLNIWIQPDLLKSDSLGIDGQFVLQASVSLIAEDGTSEIEVAFWGAVKGAKPIYKKEIYQVGTVSPIIQTMPMPKGLERFSTALRFKSPAVYKLKEVKIVSVSERDK